MAASQNSRAATPGPPVIVMGVSGAGKTTIARALAARLGLQFLDGDDLHSPENRAKMAVGRPLDDEDRAPWLEAIALRIGTEFAEGRAIVVACSALKRAYRERLVVYAPSAVFVHLSGERELISDRQALRVHEFMADSLLESQFEALEPLATGERGFSVEARGVPEQLVADIERRLVALGRTDVRGW